MTQVMSKVMYEILIDEVKYKQAIEVMDKKRDYLLFRQAGGKDSNVLFLLVHGTEDGRMVFNGHALSSEHVLRMLIDTARIKDKGVTDVYTIACYGGMQPTIYMDGVCMSSLHDSDEPVNVGLGILMDDIHVLEVYAQ